METFHQCIHRCNRIWLWLFPPELNWLRILQGCEHTFSALQMISSTRLICIPLTCSQASTETNTLTMINLNQATAPFRIETRLITRRKEESGEGTALAVIFVRHTPPLVHRSPHKWPNEDTALTGMSFVRCWAVVSSAPQAAATAPLYWSALAIISLLHCPRRIVPWRRGLIFSGAEGTWDHLLGPWPNVRLELFATPLNYNIIVSACPNATIGSFWVPPIFHEQ